MGIKHDDIRGSVRIHQYGERFYLLDKDHVIVGDGDAPGRVTDAIVHLVNEKCGGHQFSRDVTSHVAAKRGFTIGVSCYDIDGKDYLVPSFNGINVTSLKSDMTVCLKMGADVTLYALKSSQMPCGVDHESPVGQHRLTDLNHAMSYAMAAGLIASSGVVLVYPQRIDNATEYDKVVNGTEHYWGTTAKLRFDNTPRASRDDRFNSVRWFTRIDNQTYLKAKDSSPYYLAWRTEISRLLDSLGMREDYIQAEIMAEEEFSRRCGLHPGHPDRSSPTEPIVLTLHDHLADIRMAVTRSGKLRGIVSKAMGCDNSVAEGELGKAFDSGCRGELVPCNHVAVMA